MTDDIVSDVVIKKFMIMVMTKKIWWKGENDENDRDNDQDFDDDDDINNDNANDDNDVDDSDDDDDDDHNVRCNDLWIIQCQKRYSTRKSSSQKDLSFKHGEYTFIIHWIISFQVKFLLFLLGDFLSVSLLSQKWS